MTLLGRQYSMVKRNMYLSAFKELEFIVNWLFCSHLQCTCSEAGLQFKWHDNNTEGDITTQLEAFSFMFTYINCFAKKFYTKRIIKHFSRKGCVYRDKGWFS